MRRALKYLTTIQVALLAVVFCISPAPIAIAEGGGWETCRCGFEGGEPHCDVLGCDDIGCTIVEKASCQAQEEAWCNCSGHAIPVDCYTNCVYN